MVRLILGAIVGFFAGASLTKRHKKTLEKIEAGTANSVAKKVLVDGRRSLVIAHTLVRMQLSRAFLSTARRYAPVPLTFTNAVLATYIPIMGTAVGGTLIVVTFCRLAITRLQHRQRNSESPRRPNRQQRRLAEAERVEDRENIAVSAIEAVAGLMVYTSGKRAWMSSPLRGGLSVFGAGPGLDRCASKERYLAEKLVQFSDATVGGVMSLSSMAGLSVGRGDVNNTIGSMLAYARRSTRVQNLLVSPEFGEAWQAFAGKVGTHGKEMKRIADGIYYPKVSGVDGAPARGVLRVVNMTDPLKKFTQSSKDVGVVLADLVKDLGAARGGLLLSVFSSMLLGACVGSEMAALVL